jgi:hypothetical protein
MAFRALPFGQCSVGKTVIQGQLMFGRMKNFPQPSLVPRQKFRAIRQRDLEHG